MALGPSDPIPSVHQFLALAEMPEVDDYERNLIAWHRERLFAVRQNPTPTAWLSWYREVMGAIQQLSSRWAQAKLEVTPSPRQEHPQVAALARLKDASGPFLQRWNLRIQDQATALKDQLLNQLQKVPIEEIVGATHITFRVSQEDRDRLSQYVAHSLTLWSRDVEAKLTPSWLEHVHKSLTAEYLPLPPSKPPPWPILSLIPSNLPSAHFQQQSTRRPTLSQSILRMFQSTRSLFASFVITIIGGISIFSDNKSATQNTRLAQFILGLLSLFVAASIGVFWGNKKLHEELDHLRDEQRQRSLQIIQSWVASVVDNHKNRLQSLLSSTGSDVRSRLGEWVDVSWPIPSQSPPVATKRDVNALSFSLNSAKSAIASRISQIEFELSSLPPAQRS
jgi:hypothetical protein